MLPIFTVAVFQEIAFFSQVYWFATYKSQCHHHSLRDNTDPIQQTKYEHYPLNHAFHPSQLVEVVCSIPTDVNHLPLKGKKKLHVWHLHETQ